MNKCVYDLLSSIKNGQLSKKRFVIHKKTTISEKVLNIMWNEGFIYGYSSLNKKSLKIMLKYTEAGPAIRSIKIISRPGLRLRLKINQIWKIKFYQGILLFSTDKGVLTIQECKKFNVGGEPFAILK